MIRCSPGYDDERAEFEPPCSVALMSCDSDEGPELVQHSEQSKNLLLLKPENAASLELTEKIQEQQVPITKTSGSSQGLQALIAAATIHKEVGEEKSNTNSTSHEERDPPAVRIPVPTQNNEVNSQVTLRRKNFLSSSNRVRNEIWNDCRHFGQESQCFQQRPKRIKLSMEESDGESDRPEYQKQWESIYMDEREEPPQRQLHPTQNVNERLSIWRQRGSSLRKRTHSLESIVEDRMMSSSSADYSSSSTVEDSCPPSPSVILARRIKRVSFHQNDVSASFAPPEPNHRVARQALRPHALRPQFLRRRCVTYPHLSPSDQRPSRSSDDLVRETERRRVRFFKCTRMYSVVHEKFPATAGVPGATFHESSDGYVENITPRQVPQYTSLEVEPKPDCDIEAPPENIQRAKRKSWGCDICRNATFATYEEASSHEKKCRQEAKLQVGEAEHNVLENDTMLSASREKDEGDAESGASRDDQGALRANLGDDRESMGGHHTSSWYSGCVPLAVSTDNEWLSDLNCFLRKKCIEAFSATEEDVLTTSKRGRIALDQVGIRCSFCAVKPHSERAVASVSYPVSISGIYESVKRWQRVHLPSCREIPADMKRQVDELQASCVWVPTTRQYWSDSAKAIGMVDTSDGIRFERDPASPGPVEKYIISSSDPNGAACTNFTALVRQEDKNLVPPYVFALMEQVSPCRFTEADRFLARSKGPIGFAGFECRHCSGHAGLGKYFPTSSKSLSTNSTSQNIHSHLMKCRRCPPEVKENLESLKDSRVKSGLPHGWRRTFFDRVWSRLHGSS